MSSLTQSPIGALPARFRRERLLIVGCGDVGMRVAKSPARQLRKLALTSSPERVAQLRAAGITPLWGNLDQPTTLRRLAGLATRVLYLAPPPSEGQSLWWRDPRSLSLLRTMRLRTPPYSLVYGSTSGVYGDCAGQIVSEVRAVSPHTPRAHRRVDAERAMRHYGRATGVRTAVLRIPGIYAPDRQGGTPPDRLLKAMPVLRPEDDVYTNHIHADDLARACMLALWRARPQRVYHVCDDVHLKMGEYFDLAADLYGLPRPVRVARSLAQQQLPLMLLSFMGESRRLDNARIKRELRLTWLYPSPAQGLLGQAGQKR